MIRLESGRTCLYQWDIDQRVIIENNEIVEVHFANAVTSPALVCEVYEENGRRYANIPNILLQQFWPMQVYGCCAARVRDVETYRVMRRERPADYVYTETEVKTFDALDKRIKDLEAHPPGGGASEEQLTEVLTEAKQYTDDAVEGVVKTGPVTEIMPAVMGDMVLFMDSDRGEIVWKHMSEVLEEEGVPDEISVQSAVDDALNAANAYTDRQIAAIPTPDVSGQIGQHNASEDAHPYIRDLVKALADRLKALADSDDTTLDQFSEIVAYIKSNKSLIDAITTSKVSVGDIINNLTTNAAGKPLSAAQGVVLRTMIEAIVAPTALSQLTGDAAHRTVTDAEKAAWDAKSDFSGAYGDLTGKPTIPTVPKNVSAFTNDAGYLTEHQDISGKLDANKLPGAIDDALEQAKASGEFDGKNGTSVTVKSVSESTADGGSNVVTFSDGKTLTVKNGSKGSPGYTPQRLIDYWTPADQESIVQQVIAALGTPVYGTVDENKHITLSGHLADGTYALTFEDTDGFVSDVCTIEKTAVPDGPVDVPLVWIIGTKINKSDGSIESTNDANYCATDFIAIEASKTYVLTRESNASNTTSLCWYNDSGALVKYDANWFESHSNDGILSGTLPVPSGATRLRLRMWHQKSGDQVEALTKTYSLTAE